MTPRTLAVWTAIVAALLGLYLWSVRSPAPLPDAPLIVLEKESLREIDIQNPPQPPIHLAREGERWMRAGDTEQTDADTAAVSGVLNMLFSLRADALVTDSPAKWPLFDLADTTHLMITLGDSPSVVVHAGKASPDGAFTYMRLGEDPRVWAVPGFQQWAVDRLGH